MENESSSSSDEIDEEQALKDLLKLENGREFLSFVQTRRDGLLKSATITDNMSVMIAPISPNNSTRVG